MTIATAHHDPKRLADLQPKKTVTKDQVHPMLRPTS